LAGDSARNDKTLDMTEKLFTALDVYDDTTPRSAALNMAIDEALLEHASSPSIRFYRWDHPALSFGYFGKFADVANYSMERDLVRRWTGGGIVFHGNDLTYSIIIPVQDSAFTESSISIYEKIHNALRAALATNGQSVELATVAAVCDRRSHSDSALIERRYRECFANPVRADVLSNGCKVAGAAQRRTRLGLLQQGSIRDVDLENGLEKRFAGKLSDEAIARTFNGSIVDRACEIASQKYETETWLHKR
jgi:lipoate-protein ligase A